MPDINVTSPVVQGGAAGTALTGVAAEYWYSPYWDPIYSLLPFAELAQVLGVSVIALGIFKWGKTQVKHRISVRKNKDLLL